ncbi:hypothetical protein [Agromyces bauzanensis]
MDWTFWIGVAVTVAACAMTACVLSIQRRAEQPRLSSLGYDDAELDLEQEKERGLYLSGWVP